MTISLDMQIQLGGDPRRYREFELLEDELARLAHPACPDVDWVRIEQLCLKLFQADGAQLQSAAAFALARSQLYGLTGMLEGIALIEMLARQWPHLWPLQAPLREAILAGLFEQLQKILRSQPAQQRHMTALDHLDARLVRLHGLLGDAAPASLAALQALRQQVDLLIRRLQVEVRAGQSPSLPQTMPQLMPEPVPVVLLPPMAAQIRPASAHRKSRRWLWLGAVATLFVAMLLTAMSVWLIGPYQPAPAIETEPVALDSLMLFDAGSADLKPGANNVLIKALLAIKARPGWLVVITGHADATGSAEQNLQVSLARAHAVRDWLQRMGDIPPGCLTVQGLAASQPVAGNDTGGGRSANRRVDIRLVPHKGGCGSVP